MMDLIKDILTMPIPLWKILLNVAAYIVAFEAGYRLEMYCERRRRRA